MKRLLLSLCLLGPALATYSGAETPALIEARKALSEKIPQVAEQKLRTLLAEKDIAAPDQSSARELLAQALLDSGKHDEALEIAKQLNPTAENAVLRANIHVALGRWEEALPLYQQGIPETSARVGEAEALQALGRTTEAVGLLEALVKSNIGGNPLRLRLASLLTEV
jgi:tetratricopeptide (TPR) repeat protein